MILVQVVWFYSVIAVAAGYNSDLNKNTLSYIEYSRCGTLYNKKTYHKENFSPRKLYIDQ